jgi:AcrR family transcriptional regulator
MPLKPQQSKKIESIIKDSDLIEKKRRIIIKAASRLFVKKGFFRTTVSEIAKESGLTSGTLYNYIREKEDILFLMHEDLQKKVIDQIDLGMQQGTDIQSWTENVFNNVLELIKKHPKTFKLIYIETASQTKISLKVLLQRESEIIEKFRDLINIGVKQKIFVVKNQRLAASIIHFLIFYQSLNTWDIKRMGIPDSDIKRYILLCIYRILGFKKKPRKK